MENFQTFSTWLWGRLGAELTFVSEMVPLKVEAFLIDLQLVWVDLKLAWYLR